MKIVELVLHTKELEIVKLATRPTYYLFYSPKKNADEWHVISMTKSQREDALILIMIIILN